MPSTQASAGTRTSSRSTASTRRSRTRCGAHGALARLTALHGTTGLLLPRLLERGHFRFLARHEAGELVAGAVARLGSGVVDVSNVFAVPGHAVHWTELVQEIQATFPGRPIVGFESGEALDDALGAGFAPVGELRVWVR